MDAGLRHIAEGDYLTGERKLAPTAQAYVSEPLAEASLAASYEGQLRWRDAIDCWRKARAAAPGSRLVEIDARIANCHLHTGAISDARQMAERIADAYPGMALLAQLYSMIDPDEAERRWSACNIRFPEECNGFIGHIAHLFKQGSIEAAGKLADHAAQVWPESAHLAALWAHHPAALRDYETAQSRWLSVLDRFGHHRGICASFLRFRARMAADVGEDPQPSSTADPRSACELALASAIIRMDYSLALEASRRLHDPAQEDPRLALRHVWLLQKAHGQEGRKEALARIDVLRSRAPEDFMLALWDAELRLVAGDLDGAEMALRQLQECAEMPEYLCLRASIDMHRSHHPDRVRCSALFFDFGFLDHLKLSALLSCQQVFRSADSVFAPGVAERWRALV